MTWCSRHAHLVYANVCAPVPAGEIESAGADPVSVFIFRFQAMLVENLFDPNLSAFYFGINCRTTFILIVIE